MKQYDLVISGIQIVLNVDEKGMWTDDVLIFLQDDVSKKEISSVIEYLFAEGFILDRRIRYVIK